MPEISASPLKAEKDFMRCQEFREILDSYLSDELLVETNHEVLRHLENCARCREELSARRNLRSQLRSAIKNSPEMLMNQGFAKRLQTDLREAALRPNIWEKFKNAKFNQSKFLVAAACVLIFFLFGLVLFRNFSAKETVVVQQNQPAKTDEIPRPAESPLATAVRAVWQEMAQTAIGDHENCAIKFNLAERPITLKQAAEKYGGFYKDLDKVIVAALRENPAHKNSDKIEFLEAHSCVFQGRRFAHVILRYHQTKVSLLVTDADLNDENYVSTFDQSDKTMHVAGFHTDHHAVFVVSDLTEAENSSIAQKLFPDVRRHIERTEA